MALGHSCRPPGVKLRDSSLSTTRGKPPRALRRFRPGKTASEPPLASPSLSAAHPRPQRGRRVRVRNSPRQCQEHVLLHCPIFSDPSHRGLFSIPNASNCEGLGNRDRSAALFSRRRVCSSVRVRFKLSRLFWPYSAHHFYHRFRYYT